MKKVININFQGRVVPIEDSAYDLLQQYTASLRTYFAKEEGRDEIIYDIENRIGELFAEQLKKGAPCITDEHVNAIIADMGRPSDFEKADEPETASSTTGSANTAYEAGTQTTEEPFTTGTSRRLYRDEQDKILGGVSSGIGHYANIDPAVVRILFIIFTLLGGSGILLYVILWIALPSRSLVNNIRKRLYRDTEDRIFKGVCGGLAKYFDINPLIPRIIFAAPFIFGLITTLGRRFFFDGPVFIGGFSSSSFLIAYLILWAVIPEAVTASEKLEMRGEKVDLNSIRNTIMEDMQGFKGRAEKFGTEVQESATRISKQAKTAWQGQGRPFVSEASGTIRRTSGGFANAIGVLLKAFMMIVGGAIAFGLLIALVFLLSTGIGNMQLADFFLNGAWQRILGWGVILFFISAPIMAIVISIIRRMMRTKSNSRIISYTFSTLWVIGLFCLIGLIGLFSRDMRYDQPLVTDVPLTQPASGKLSLKLSPASTSYAFYNDDDGIDWEGVQFIEGDSLYTNNIRVHVIRSLDSFYHLHVVKMSSGGTREKANQRNEKIVFPVVQNGESIYLPENFAVSSMDKWRNQRVLVVMEVPVGKVINVSRDLNDYNWFNLSFNRRRTRVIDRHWYDDQTWNSDKDMIQTFDDGLKRAGKYDEKGKTYRYEDQDNDGDWEDENRPARPAAPVNPTAPLPADTIRRIDTAYRYPTSAVQVSNIETKKATTSSNAIHFSPLASFLW